MNKQPEENILIHLKGISKRYSTQDNQVSILKNVNLSVCRKELVAIMGPSGSGKSTLLFILGLFLAPTSGTYTFSGQNILHLNRKEQAQFRRNRIGFVFQDSDMFEHSTVYENVEYPLIYSRSKPNNRPERIQRVLDQVNLSHRIHHSSNKLSGGEKQRVAIARALVNNPEVILADEPTGQLDAENSQQIMEYFRSISSTTDTAMIIVTHDMRVADRCDQVLQIENGQLSSQEF